MAKRRTGDAKRLKRLTHLSPDELSDLARLGAHLAMMRKSVRGLTITEASHAAGINASTLGELERGRTNVTYVVLMRIARALDMPLSALVPSSTERPPSEKPEN